VFFKIDQNVRAIIRPINVINTFAETLRWIRDPTAFGLLRTNPRSFKNCYVVDPEPDERMFDVSAKRIISKGLIVEQSNMLYVFPMFAFDHD
jgi:hypothetical protein